MAAKKKTTAKKKTAAKAKTPAKKKTTAAKKATKKATKKSTKKKVEQRTATAKKKTERRTTSKKKKTSARAASARVSRDPSIMPWAQRFKQESSGPWTCPKCGPLPLRAQPLYGEDERHHCPNLDCDKVVTLLTKEDLEPTERRTGSWPPQRNKQRPGGGSPGSTE